MIVIYWQFYSKNTAIEILGFFLVKCINEQTHLNTLDRHQSRRNHRVHKTQTGGRRAALPGLIKYKIVHY